MAKVNILRGKRGALKLTQKEVADRMGTSQVQYQQYESMKHKPGPANVIKIAEALDLPVEVVIDFFN